MNGTCLIIGASHAAAQMGPSLRQSGWEGKILIIGDEPHIPYHRPPLSKDFLAGKKQMADIRIRPEDLYQKAGIEFLLGRRVEAIHPDRKRVRLDDGEELPYDNLALTVGSRVRRVDLPGVDLAGVHYLRTAEDVEAIRKHVAPGANAVIVGGGYIGLETAAVLRSAGMNVTVVEMMERIMQRVTAPEVSAFYTRVHREEGVDIRCNLGVGAFEGQGRVEAVRCSDGTRLPADLVIIGVGIVPNVELARDAGLKAENGIVVDQHSRTSDPAIVAAGDCTWHHNPIYDRWLRLESVQNATDQARVAADTLCGKLTPYNALPWFWSDQYDLKLQIAGLSQGYDEVVTRGERDQGRSFAAFYLKQGRVIAVDAVNRPPEFMTGKKLITEARPVDKTRLADAAVPMRELLSAG
ncbi:MAG: pyridine nucleotide-disulfide oxidoreductase [Gammaproteobacteria bacterium RIFCSPLOWO2_02_FULL_61_13]|nr:MAG: pyridine nucleotide-disulfide oxidoreductase [Gammaproteobacteria bacterium RIFCSPLOWO2_02_FULL_61_13]